MSITPSLDNSNTFLFTNQAKILDAFYQNKIGWCNLTTKEEQSFSIDLPQNTYIMEKYGYSLSNEDLNYLKNLNIKEVDVCGLKSEACVYAIALQLWDNGIYPNLLVDYILGDVNPDLDLEMDTDIDGYVTLLEIDFLSLPHSEMLLFGDLAISGGHYVFLIKETDLMNLNFNDVKFVDVDY